MTCSKQSTDISLDLHLHSLDGHKQVRYDQVFAEKTFVGDTAALMRAEKHTHNNSEGSIPPARTALVAYEKKSRQKADDNSTFHTTDPKLQVLRKKLLNDGHGQPR